MDRLSNLPDTLLHTILSFMQIQDVVKTTILSKRWESLWISVTDLKFEYKEKNNDSSPLSSQFVDLVNRALLFRGQIKMKSLSISLPFNNSINRKDLDLWIRYALQNDVEKLRLALDSSQILYELPQFLYTYSSFKILNLSTCDISVPRQICWSSLESLTLWRSTLHEEVIQLVLSGSPNLEFLLIAFCKGFNGLSTNSTSLKKLIIIFTGPEERDESEIRISAPNVTSLHLSGWLLRKCLLVDLSSLVHATVSIYKGIFGDVHVKEYNMLLEIFESVVHAENLTLGSWLIQALSVKEQEGLSSPPSKRKYLTLQTPMEEKNIPGILHLLKCSPNLEKLALVWTPSTSFEEPDKEFVEWSNSGGENTFNCLLHNLKVVNIYQFDDQELLFPLVEFLLKYAKVLERMVIRAKKQASSSSESLLHTSQKLLSIPRSSPGVVVIFLT